MTYMSRFKIGGVRVRLLQSKMVVSVNYLTTDNLKKIKTNFFLTRKSKL